MAVPQAAANTGSPVRGVRQLSDYNWSQTPSGSISPGSNTLTLSPCPEGMNLTRYNTPGRGVPAFSVYLPDHGTAEAAPVTGGNCHSGAPSGTIIITAANGHSAGFTVHSASAGLQEMMNDSCDPSGVNMGILPVRGLVPIYAETFVPCSDLTIDFTGSVLQSYVMGATTLFVGFPQQSTAVYNVTLMNPRGQAEVTGNQHPFIEVNAQKTRILNLTTEYPYANPHATWSSYLQVDDDQSFLLDGFDSLWGSSAGGTSLRCDPTVCNSYITTGPGYAVGWLKHMNISSGHGNCVDWQSGNTLTVTDSSCQNFSEFGFRAGVAHGGYFGMSLDNVYFENGGPNPMGNVGKANVIEQGLTVQLSGPTGTVMSTGRSLNNFPSFPTSGASGNILYRYYVVPHHAKYGAGNALLAGMAKTNGIGDIKVTWPDIPGLVGSGTYDLLRVTSANKGSVETQGPYGTGNWAVAEGLKESSVCRAGICTLIDKQAPLSTYKVPPVYYYPLLNYWPGGVVLSASMDTYDVSKAGSLLTTVGVAGINSVAGPNMISVAAEFCSGAPGLSSPLLMTCTGDDSLSATLLRAGGGVVPNSKGRLNFGPINAGLPNHVVTWADSDWQKTAAADQHRPINDPGDAFTGFDQNGGLMHGAPVSISNYIGNVGDGTNWEERLSHSVKTFRVPIATPGAALALSTTAIPANSCAKPQSAKLAGATGSSVIKWSFNSNPIAVAGYGVGALQISTFPTQNTANVVVCNITGHSVNPGAIGVNLRLEE